MNLSCLLCCILILLFLRIIFKRAEREKRATCVRLLPFSQFSSVKLLPTPMQIQKDKKGPRFLRQYSVYTRKWARSSCISVSRESLLYTPIHPIPAEALVHLFIASPPAYPTTVTCGTPAVAHLSFTVKLVPWHSLIHRTHHLLLHL